MWKPDGTAARRDAGSINIPKNDWGDDMSYKNLLLENKDGFAVISINRPQALNALNQEVLVELYEIFNEVNTNPEIKTVALTGAGEKAFVAGADIASMEGARAVAAT